MDITTARNTYDNLVNRFLLITAETDILDYIEDGHRNKLNGLLNELNSLDYRSLQIGDSKLAHCLIVALSNIPISEDTLIAKACCLLSAMIHKQLQTLPVDTITKTLDWLMKSIRHHRNIGICESLGAIQSLIKANAPSVPLVATEKITALVTLMIDLIENPNCLANKSSAAKYESCRPNEIRLSTVLCMETVMQAASDLNATKCADTLRVVLNLLYADMPDNEDCCDSGTCLLQTSALNICRTVCLIQRSLCVAHIGELLGAGRAFMLHGLPGAPVAAASKVNVSQQAIAEPQMAELTASKGGKVARQRKSKPNVKSKKSTPSKQKDAQCVPIVSTTTRLDQFDFSTGFTITSDSDFSESESYRQRQDQQQKTKLRLAALGLIGVLGQIIETKVLFGYWHSLFPTESTGLIAIGLLNCVLRDPNPRCRIAALQATASWLHGSKSFLTRAENCDRPPTSYRPFSLALGDMIVYMYETLTQAVLTESSLPVLTQILKCLIALIQVTTFKRLKCTFVTQFVSHVRKLVYHKDPTIQVAALMAMEVLMSCNEGQPDIMELFGISQRPRNADNHKLNSGQNDMADNEELTKTIDLDEWDESYGDTVVPVPQAQPSASSSSDMSWLLQISLENLGITVSSLKTASLAIAPVRIECLQVVATMSHHFHLLKKHLVMISSALEIAFKDTNSEIRFNAIRCFDVVGHSISTFLLVEGPSSAEVAKSCTKFWIVIIPHIMIQLQDDASNATAKALCCDSLSNIGVHIFESLPRNQQITLISVLSGASCDEELSIRAAAIRALAVYVMFPSLREDLCYVENTAEAVIRSMASTNLEIRVKGSWALGNITDTLLLNSSEHSVDPISNDLLRRLFETAISCKANDKVRSNGVRALGNLLRLLNAEHLCCEQWRQICMHSVQHLHQFGTVATGNMKVKWNACYAIGNFMRNPHMFSPELCLFFDWQALILPALCKVIVEFPNFKVRINAAVALAVPARRDHLFGAHFAAVWFALLESLEESDHIADFNEYLHRDNLVDQLCLTVAHYIGLAEVVDLPTMALQLKRFEAIAAKWLRVLNRMVPERATSLLTAGVRLKALQAEPIKPDQRTALDTLCACFVHQL